MGRHDDQPSFWSPWRQTLKVLIYWEFQRISHISLARLGIWELRVQPLLSLQKGLNGGQRVLTTAKMYLTGSQEDLLGAAEEELVSQLSPGLPDTWGGSQSHFAATTPRVVLTAAPGGPQSN